MHQQETLLYISFFLSIISFIVNIYLCSVCIALDNRSELQKDNQIHDLFDEMAILKQEIYELQELQLHAMNNESRNFHSRNL
jgi:hypothetical protein